MDDLDIEVSNLRTGYSTQHLAEGKSPEGDCPERKGIYWKRSATTRRVLISVVVLAGILIVFVRAYLLLIPTSTPRPSDTASHNILFAHAAPWGRLSIDGHREANINYLSFVSLPVGRHILLYQASPFPDVHCVFHIPAMSSDTCPRYHPVEGDWYAGSQNLIVDLGVTFRSMPRSQLSAFVRAAQSALDTAISEAQLLPGEHYISSDGRILVAERPITVELQYEVAKNVQALGTEGYGIESCSQSCTSSDQQQYGWFVNIPILMKWSYMLPTGARAIVPSTTQLANVAPTFTALYVNWTGSWQIALPEDPTMDPNSTICTLAETGASQLATANLRSDEETNISSTPSSESADGCVTTITLGAPSASQTQAELLFRFGVYFAANADAHRLFPSLPLASSQEMAFVSNLLQTP